MAKSVREMKGVGEKTQKLLEKLGIFTTEDLLQYFPVKYESYERAIPIRNLKEGEEHTVCAFPLCVPSPSASGGGKGKLSVKVKDESGSLTVVWFGSDYLRHVLRPGQRICLRGRCVKVGGSLILSHPQILTPSEYDSLAGTLQPVYGLTKGLSNKLMVRLVKQALEEEEREIPEYLPEELVKGLGLCSEAEARRAIHLPEGAGERERAHRRLVFDEFFQFILAVQLMKQRVGMSENTYPMEKDWESEKVIRALPFELTGAQRRTWEEVETSLCSRSLMNRLVQGDVGSGKTVIAFLAMLKAVRAGYQAALMCPTAVLAAQHMEGFEKFLAGQQIQGIRPVLLTGSLPAAQRRRAREGIAMGTYQVIIGTHALISEGVEYQDLGLAVIDEQHRFGVHQREALSRMGRAPHVLVMSATPIPRTLALILYGDMDISVMDEKPKNRLPIRNAAVNPAWRPNAYRFLRKELEKGHQAYVICPMVEATEGLEAENVLDYVAKLKKELPEASLGVLHGRMKAGQKDKVMEGFASGEIQILVSTTVVEVGVDVPNATVIMIENAERFGLAQLHQLRGRVGRGRDQSYCILVQGTQEEEARGRLEFLSKTNDGFLIAEEDLRIRGQGDFFGTRQSGDLSFALGDIYRDSSILKVASAAVGELLQADPGLVYPSHRALRERMALSYPLDGSVTM